MLLAEEQRSEHKHHIKPITQEDLDAKEREYLCSPLSVELYFMWQSFGGGMGASLSLTEILAMPTWLRRDFRYLHRMIHDARQDRQDADAWFAEQSKGMKL